MKLEPNKVYKVTKGNTDRSVLVGDLVYIEGKTGSLVIPNGKGWLNKNELTQEVMDFEVDGDYHDDYIYEILMVRG